jgi:hypothetical protein
MPEIETPDLFDLDIEDEAEAAPQDGNAIPPRTITTCAIC